MIIDEPIRRLVRELEADQEPGSAASNAAGAELVLRLRERCALPENRRRIAEYAAAPGALGPYPLDLDGYALAYDVLEEEEAFFAAWMRFGIVVGREAAPPARCAEAVERVRELAGALSDGRCDLEHPATWSSLPSDRDGNPLVSRGFFEVYHDDALAQLRQSVRAYLQHVLIWGRADLWTTFDRFGLKLPGHEASKALPLHVDQNPHLQGGFETVQGVLALADCPAERGTYVGVPGSKAVFEAYRATAGRHGDYVELDRGAPFARELERFAQPFPLRAGDLVSWDSRTTHANTENTSDEARFIALVAAGPAREADTVARQVRYEAWRTGVGSNIRDAYLHASKRPRFTDPLLLQRVRRPERLTLIGTLLYGQRAYDDL